MSTIEPVAFRCESCKRVLTVDEARLPHLAADGMSAAECHGVLAPLYDQQRPWVITPDGIGWVAEDLESLNSFGVKLAPNLEKVIAKDKCTQVEPFTHVDTVKTIEYGIGSQTMGSALLQEFDCANLDGDRAFFLYRLLVLPKYRGNHVATKILDKAKLQARLFSRILFLSPSPYMDEPMTSEELVGWYERQGFVKRDDIPEGWMVFNQWEDES